MINRDFTKTNKAYFAKNKFALISVAVFLIIGVITALIFGMNGNFEMKGYNEFSVTVKESSTYSASVNKLEEIVNNHGGNVETVLIAGEGDNTKLIVRYMNGFTADEKFKIEAEVIESLGVSELDVSDHTYVKAAVRDIDYVYTAAAILLLVTIASVFAYLRYNAASALSIIISCVLGSLGFMSIGAILRLAVGLSYFAMLVALNMLIVYFALDMFENMRTNSWLGSGDYANALKSSIKISKGRQCFISVAIMVLGILFVVFGTNPLKYVSLNLMFMAVVLLACAWYVIPFVWSVFITKCKNKEYQVKASTVEDLKEENKD